MHIFTQDSNVVGENESQLVEFYQSGPVQMAMFMTNAGANTLNYRFEEWTGTAWVAMGAVGSVYYNTLISGQTTSLLVNSSYGRVHLVGSASGGAILDFSVDRVFNRTSGGAMPILSL